MNETMLVGAEYVTICCELFEYMSMIDGSGVPSYSHTPDEVEMDVLLHFDFVCA